MTIACVTDFRREAEKRLPRFLFDYIDGGAYAEVTLRRNVADLAEIALRQRVLVDVSRIDLRTRLFGCELAMPVGLGPVGMSGMYARRGEAQAARAAAAKGIPTCLSSVSVCDLREVAAAGANPLWFQLYVIKDRAYMAELLAVAREVKCAALVFTVDLPVPGARYRDAHSGLTGTNTRWKRLRQILSHPRWAWDVGIKGKPHSLGNFAPVVGKAGGLDDYVGWIGRNFDASIAWQDIGWIRSHWDGPLLIKGILDVEDAREAVKLGADGIVVSNHGGRQLDGVLSTARALPGDRRRGRRRSDHPRRRRHPLRARRAAHARARRQGRAARPRLGLCAGGARRGRAWRRCSTSSRPSCASRCSSPASLPSTRWIALSSLHEDPALRAARARRSAARSSMSCRPAAARSRHCARRWRSEHGGLAATNVRACIDHEIAPESALVLPGQEVAFLPPLSGG